jgi:hypothetical protein
MTENIHKARDSMFAYGLITAQKQRQDMATENVRSVCTAAKSQKCISHCETQSKTVCRIVKSQQQQSAKKVE